MQRSSHPLLADTSFGFVDRNTSSPQIYNPVLVANRDDNHMLKAILHELKRSRSFTFSVAFITTGALGLLKQALIDFPGEGTIITSNYLDFNSPEVFSELLDLPNVQVTIHEDRNSPFHTKAYVFEQAGSSTAIVGSSNLTRNALLVNNEWNLRFSAMPDGDIVDQIHSTLEDQKAHGHPLTQDWIDQYAAHRRPTITPDDLKTDDEKVLPVGEIVPNDMQVEALDAIERVWKSEEKRAVVISATGTGKTILAALAVRQAAPKRFLFVVHREQILDKAIAEFQRVLNFSDAECGKIAGRNKDFDPKYVFATIQSLSRPETLNQLDPHAFDFIVIDEVHRAGAMGYQNIIKHFNPQKLLGLTATPERTDGFNIFELFDHNVPFEIRLQEALDSKMLAPFNYYGVTDYTDDRGQSTTNTSDLSKLVEPERIRHLLKMIRQYGHKGEVRGLMFCSSKREAHEMSNLLNQESVNGRILRTKALTGDSSMDEREQTVGLLEAGDIDYILTVDIFNEGIDIPSVNQVVMLRNTQSSIIFTQQLGRGLRKHAGKDHLRVIDFIGNYSNNFLIPIALFGDNSRNKHSIKKRVIEAQNSGAIAGVSSVNFDAIAKERIFASLDQVKLDSFANLKSAFQELEFRLGATPKRIDFARFDTIDPVLLCTSSNLKGKDRNYWGFIQKLGKVKVLPTVDEGNMLRFLDTEILNGMRPHELILVRELLRKNTLSKKQFKDILEQEGLTNSDFVINSVRQVLTLDFYTEPDRIKFHPILDPQSSGLSPHPEFLNAYQASSTFTEHVDDVIETGLYLARHKYDWASDMKVGKIYSRKDVTRLLNWNKSDIPQNIGGYKLDKATMTCPIFVTYHKDEAISETTKYEDAFLDPSLMRWFTKSKRTMGSPTESKIIHGEADLHLLVKKSDKDNTAFFYLGKVSPSSSRDTQMPGKDAKPVNVVEMKLHLEQPVSDGLFDFFVGDPSMYLEHRRAVPAEPQASLHSTK